MLYNTLFRFAVVRSGIVGSKMRTSLYSTSAAVVTGEPGAHEQDGNKKTSLRCGCSEQRRDNINGSRPMHGTLRLTEELIPIIDDIGFLFQLLHPFHHHLLLLFLQHLLRKDRLLHIECRSVKRRA